MNNKEVYHLLSKKTLMSVSTYELIQAFEIPVSEFIKFGGNLVS